MRREWLRVALVIEYPGHPRPGHSSQRLVLDMPTVVRRFRQVFRLVLRSSGFCVQRESTKIPRSRDWRQQTVGQRENENG